MSFKNQFISKLLKRKYRESERSVQVINLNHAKTAGVLWKVDDLEAFNMLTEELKSRGVEVNSLCFSEQRGSVQGEAVLTKDDFSIFGKVKNEEIVRFVDQKFDILLDISLSSRIELLYLRCLSKAKFKVGWSAKAPDYFDLSIDISKRKEASFLVKQMLYYLSEINKIEINN
ncbi:DUF6913 domain-containing protein [uncultured Sunxiuqinia sp.]|uniref:DUF6913 domain-containing protein n=1 Tax=uncultured Sunxiuqinia sp. TaxID=1573825 RepID=UPI002AA89A39|nr:hypothetical protein [uncultured Sunxiuqinia sp.]